MMTAPTLFRVLACTALLSAPLHAQLYTLHGDGVKKTERVVEKADYSDYELVWHDEFDKDGPPGPRQVELRTRIRPQQGGTVVPAGKRPVRGRHADY